jgi:hypothetical protein
VNKRRSRTMVVTMVSALLLTSVFYQSADAAPPASTAQTAATAAPVAPVLAEDFQPATPPSAAESEQMQARSDALRLTAGARVKQPARAGAAPAPKANASFAGASTDPTTKVHGNPADLIIGRNNANTVANTNTCGTGSALAEPAAANEGRNVYYTGNLRHQEFSTNGGATWTCAAAYPAGPAAAPTAFGDTDVIYDHARGVTFHSVIYVNAGLTDGVVRIFVRRNITQTDNCSYTIDFDPTANVIPDYPHLGLSNDFLYLTVNRQGTTGFVGATIRRLPIDEMVDCVTAGGQIINFANGGDTRILVPGHGARDVMYLAWVNTTSQWRVFSWAAASSDSASAPPSATASCTYGLPSRRTPDTPTPTSRGRCCVSAPRRTR